MAYGIGNKKVMKCWDGKEHECTITDCQVILKGNTYQHKGTIKADGFGWWADEKYWLKLVDSEEEIEALVSKYSSLGIRGQVKVNWRITDTDINPLGRV